MFRQLFRLKKTKTRRPVKYKFRLTSRELYSTNNTNIDWGIVRSTNATLLTVNMTVVEDIFPPVELVRRAIETRMRTLHNRMIPNGTPYVTIKLVNIQIPHNFASFRFAKELREQDPDFSSLVHMKCRLNPNSITVMITQAMTVFRKLNISRTRMGLQTHATLSMVISTMLQAETPHNMIVIREYHLQLIDEYELISLPVRPLIQFLVAPVLTYPMSAQATAVNRKPVDVPLYVLVCKTAMAKLLFIHAIVTMIKKT